MQKAVENHTQLYFVALALPWFRPPLTPPNLGGEEISLSIPFPLLLLGGVSEGRKHGAKLV